MLGTERIDKALETLGDVVMGFAHAYADDKHVSLSEIGGIVVSEGGDLLNVLTHTSDLIAELKDWDPSERVASIEKFMDHLKLPDFPTAEKKAKYLLQVAVYISLFISGDEEETGEAVPE